MSTLKRLTLVWIGLAVATLVAVAIGETSGHGDTGAKIATELVFVVAVAKVRFVGTYFMGLRGAPRAFVLGYDGWCAAVFLVLSATYLGR